MVYLATDPDREGEAISWHLSKALKLEPSRMKRITFNEITKTAVKESLKNARDIDMDLVDAQQARRILDRMVGYEISPLLWKKIKRGLSAGRVQSVALRIIADREEEINAFIPKEYWTLDASFAVDQQKKPLTAHFYGSDKKMEISSREELEQILAELEGAEYEVQEIRKGTRTRKAPLPFTTSTLQQEASNALNMSTYKTMQIAQQLYEGIDIPKTGTVGLISYLRTDSTRISGEADAAARAYIEETFGKDNLADAAFGNQNKNKNAQDAHEAIRPTDITRTPASIKEYLSRDQFRLYQLIWKRFAASRMANAVYETSTVRIRGGKYIFTASASSLVFRGFLNVYSDDSDGHEQDDHIGKIDQNSSLKLLKFEEEQHFTQPPAHYTEASLVREMEELGIGRPSTYAPTITTIINRRYVAREQRKLYITELGEVVNDMMKQAFPSIVDVNFTANMEMLLDGVEAGTLYWKTIIRNFWPDLKEAVDTAERELEEVEIRDEESDVICENCGRNMVIKYGPHGKFLACPGFPECRNTKPYYEKTGVSCPECGGEIVIKKTKKGRRYYGCVNQPECSFMSWQKPSNRKCPVCGGYMLEKGKKLVCANKECGFVQSAEQEEQ